MMSSAAPASFLGSLFQGDLVFLSRLPREVFAIALIVGIIVIWFLYRRVAAKLSPAMRWTLITLRAAFLLVLLAILAVPAIEKPRTRSGNLFTAVVIDASQSMSIEDVTLAGK